MTEGLSSLDRQKLTPTVYQSGGTTNLGRINRDGRQEVRKVLLQCAHAIQRTANYSAAPIREFFERIEKRRGRKRARVPPGTASPDS